MTTGWEKDNVQEEEVNTGSDGTIGWEKDNHPKPIPEPAMVEEDTVTLAENISEYRREVGYLRDAIEDLRDMIAGMETRIHALESFKRPDNPPPLDIGRTVSGDKPISD